jgi:hypothetical protein
MLGQSGTNLGPIWDQSGTNAKTINYQQRVGTSWGGNNMGNVLWGLGLSSKMCLDTDLYIDFAQLKKT